MTFQTVSENQAFKMIAEKTKDFLQGYYSAFGLELLSTIDFIQSEKKKTTHEEITAELTNWSDRKRTRFANPQFIHLALQNFNNHHIGS